MKAQCQNKEEMPSPPEETWLPLAFHSTLTAQLSDFDFNSVIHEFSFSVIFFPIHEQDPSIRTWFISVRMPSQCRGIPIL